MYPAAHFAAVLAGVCFLAYLLASFLQPIVAELARALS